MKDTIPSIEPIKFKDYESKQSKYSMVAKLPMRSVLLGPSGSGKTVLLVNMILDIYRDYENVSVYIYNKEIEESLGERPFTDSKENKDEKQQSKKMKM